MRTLLLFLFCLATLSGYAQTATPVKVPAQALSQLEDLKELTKREASSEKHKGRQHAEVNPELNRWLVVAADDFVRVTTNTPTKEAYLECIDRGLTRMAPLTHDNDDRLQVAEYYQELMEIVGLDSSEGRLSAFVGTPGAKPLLSQRETGGR
jgi:hypothetical protein